MYGISQEDSDITFSQCSMGSFQHGGRYNSIDGRFDLFSWDRDFICFRILWGKISCFESNVDGNVCVFFKISPFFRLLIELLATLDWLEMNHVRNFRFIKNLIKLNKFLCSYFPLLRRIHKFINRNAVSPSFQTKCHSNEETVSIQVQNENQWIRLPVRISRARILLSCREIQ